MSAQPLSQVRAFCNICGGLRQFTTAAPAALKGLRYESGG